MSNSGGKTDQGSKAHFYYTTTAAPANKVWSLWLDVSRWKEWDAGLKEAQAAKPLSPDVKGTIHPLSGPPAIFSVTEFDLRRSNSFDTALPLASLTVQRSILEDKPNKTVFEHRVSFHCPLRWLWAQILGDRFMHALPPTMESLARLAEGEH